MWLKIVSALLLCVSLILPVSCAKKDSTKPLQLMIWGRAEEKKAVIEFVKKFNQIYPEIKVQVLHYPDYHTKLLTMMSGGTPPDVMYMGSEDFPYYAPKDVFLDLKPFVENDPETKLGKFNLSDFYPETVAPFTYEGKLLGIPKDFTTMVLYYNKTMFDQAGIKYPNANWTWDDFLKAAQALTKPDPETGNMKYGFVYENWSGYWMSWIWQNGGEVLTKDGKSWVIGKGENLQRNADTFQFFYDLMYKYKVAPSIETTREMGSSQLFETGFVGMATYGRWRCLELKNVKNFEWDVAPLPSKNGKKASMLFTVSYSIAKTTKRPQDAWKLVKFLVGETGQINTAQSALAIPTMKKYAVSDYFMKTEGLPSINAKVYLDQIGYARVIPANPDSRKVYDIITTTLDKFYMSQLSSLEAVIQMQKDIDKYLVDYGNK